VVGSFRAGGGSGTFWNIVERGLARERGMFERGEEVELGLELGGGEGRDVGAEPLWGEADGVEVGVQVGAQGCEGVTCGWDVGHLGPPFFGVIASGELI